MTKVAPQIKRQDIQRPAGFSRIHPFQSVCPSVPPPVTVNFCLHLRFI